MKMQSNPMSNISVVKKSNGKPQFQYNDAMDLELLDIFEAD